MTSNNVPSRNNLILGVIAELFRRPGGRKGNDDLLILFLATAILFGIATAPFKILLRKKIGPNALNIFEILSGTAFWALCSIMTWSIMKEYSNDDFDNLYSQYFYNSTVLIAIFVSFIFLALYTLIKGFIEETKAKFKISGNWTEDNYRGDSLLFQRHVSTPQQQYNIWKKIEPSFCFKWSLLISIIHPVLGLPLLFTSIAFWVNEQYHVKYKWETIDTSNNAGSNEIGFVEGV